MYFYCIQFSLLSLFLYGYSKERNKEVAFFYKLVAFLILFVPAALRYKIGTDYDNYLIIYDRIISNKNESSEIGWKIINLICYYTGLGTQFLFIISSFLIYKTIFRTLTKETIIVVLVYFLYLYSPSYNLVRNSISIAFGWYSYYLITKDDKVKSLFYSIFSCFFHTSGIIYVLLTVLSFVIKLTKKQTIIIFCLLYVFFNRVNVANLLFSLPILSGYRWGAYLISEKYSASSSLGIGVLIRHCFLIMTYCLCDEKKCNKTEFQVMSFYFLALSISDFLACQIVIFFRVQICMYIAYIAMYKLLAISNKNERSYFKYLGRLLSIMYMILFVFILGLLNHENGIVPYSFVRIGDCL